MSKATNIINNIKISVAKHSPEILTGIGIAGMVTTTVLAVRATPKAVLIINDLKDELETENPPKMEIVKATWKCYIPAAASGAFSIACIVGASSVNSRRNAALATAYKITETALSEYKDAVVETIGEKKEKEVRDKVAEKKLENNPVSNNEVIITGKGTTLCFEPISGRYFESDIDKIRRAENEFNRVLLRDDYLSLNEFYDFLGLKHTQVEGDALGWRVDWGFIDLSFSSQIAEDGRPCIVINYGVPPKYGYSSAY